jgi:WD40 repeat protein
VPGEPDPSTAEPKRILRFEQPTNRPHGTYEAPLPEYAAAFMFLTSYSPSDGGSTRIVADYKITRYDPYRAWYGLRVWDFQSGRQLAFLTKGLAQVNPSCITICQHPSTNHPYIIAAYHDGDMSIWNGDDFTKVLAKPTGHKTGALFMKAYSRPDGTHPRLVLAFNDGAITVLDLDTGDCLRELESLGGEIGAILLCPCPGGGTSPILVAAGRWSVLRAYDLETGATLWTDDKKTSSNSQSLALIEEEDAGAGSGSPLLVTAGPVGISPVVEIRELRTGVVLRTFSAGGNRERNAAVAVYRDPTGAGPVRVMTGEKVYDASTGQLLQTLPPLPCGSLIVCTTENGEVRVVGADSGDGQPGDGGDGEVVVADPETGRLLHTLNERCRNGDSWDPEDIRYDGRAAHIHLAEANGRHLLLMGDHVCNYIGGWDFGPVPGSARTTLPANKLG